MRAIATRRAPVVGCAQQMMLAPIARLVALLPMAKTASRDFLAEYPNTFYAHALEFDPPARPTLQRDLDTDVCVVGGGFAGIAAALGLVERGKKVVLLEQKRIGWSASGVNGGFGLPGYAIEGSDLSEHVGDETARTLFELTTEAKKLIRRRVDQYEINCDFQEVGAITLSMFKSREKDAHTAVEEMNKVYGTSLEVWPPEKVQKLYHTNTFHHGIFDPSAFTVQPLALVLGLAGAAEDRGTLIFEHTKATKLEHTSKGDRRWQVFTENGKSVSASDVVLAGSGHLPASLDASVARAVVPCVTYIMVTEPLGDKLKTAIEAPYAACDDRFALNYFRPLPGGRLLWGGFFQTYPISEAKLKDVMLKDMLRVFPQLEGAKADFAWGGSLAYGWDLFPLIGQKEPGLWYSTGYGGHGVVPTTVGGELIASAIVDGDERYKLFEKHFPLKWTGWPFAVVGSQLFYWWLQAKDNWLLWKQKNGW